MIRLSIRLKLLLISAALLLVPWVGVHYIQDLEDVLRKNQEAELLGRAQIVAAVLQSQEGMFPDNIITATDAVEESNIHLTASSHIYVRPLKTAIQLDAYMDDWQHYQNRSQEKRSENPDSFQYTSYMGSYRHYLYVMYQVQDDSVVYRRGRSLNIVNNDHMKIIMQDKQGDIRHYVVSTVSPGWVNAHRVEFEDGDWISKAPELRIKGEWQETAQGYNLELRIPLSMIGDKLSFFIMDVDELKPHHTESGQVAMLGTSESLEQPGSVIIPSESVERMLAQVVRPASRTWVLDSQYRVLAVADNLKQKASHEYAKQETSLINKVIRLFYQLLLQQPTQVFEDKLASASYLYSDAVQSALKGQASTSWRQSSDDRVRILTASYPVIKNNQTYGAIAIEETSNAILILQNRAMEILINLSVLAFLITVIVLLTYASRLSLRIRRLRDQTEQAIGHDGRISGMLESSKAGDEIGDLSRSFSDMLNRLAEYNRYLETMASKLSHELRTPVTVVKSSLENLQMVNTADQQQVYLKRAQDGMSRLSDILTRMSEATRLEQTIQSEQSRLIDFPKLIGDCVAGYRLAHPEVEFDFQITASTCNLVAAPELIAQMLDKLVSNAVEFHTEKTPVIVMLECNSRDIVLQVINQGCYLPEQMQDNLFESMVSVREKTGAQPHLGLGLYIVRMIVEFHQGSVKVRNAKTKPGVVVEVSLPLASVLSQSVCN